MSNCCPSVCVKQRAKLYSVREGESCSNNTHRKLTNSVTTICYYLLLFAIYSEIIEFDCRLCGQEPGAAPGRRWPFSAALSGILQYILTGDPAVWHIAMYCHWRSCCLAYCNVFSLAILLSGILQWQCIVTGDPARFNGFSWCWLAN